MVNYACAFSQSELGEYFEWTIIKTFSAKRKCQVNLSKHEHCLNSGIREYLPSSITWQTWRKHDAKIGRGGKERLLARVLSFTRSGHNSTRRNRWRNEANDSKLRIQWWRSWNPQRVYLFSQPFWRAGTVCEQGKKREDKRGRLQEFSLWSTVWSGPSHFY